MFWGYANYSTDELYSLKSKQYDKLSALKAQINNAYDDLNRIKTQIQLYHDKKSFNRGYGGRKAGLWAHLFSAGSNYTHQDLLNFKSQRDTQKRYISTLKTRRNTVYNNLSLIKAEIQRRKKGR